MDSSRMDPQKVTKPFQLLATSLVGLILIDSAFLTAAININNPSWLSTLLVIASIINVPLFLISIFILQTKFRPELQDDIHYFKYLQIQMEHSAKIKKKHGTTNFISSNAIIKEVDKMTSKSASSLPIEVELRAGHYMDMGWEYKELKGVIGVNYYELDIDYSEAIGFPILELLIKNVGDEVIHINTPIINFNSPQKNIIKNDKESITAIGFLENFQSDRNRLKPGGKKKYSLFGLMIPGVVEAFINDNVKEICIETINGFSKKVPKEQIDRVKQYMEHFFNDKKWIEELQVKELNKKSNNITSGCT